MTVPHMRISEPPQRLDWKQTARRYLGNRWVLLALGSGVLVAGAALNWSWLVAAGIAPIIISLAPCAIMCGLGLCGMKMMGGSCEKQSTPSAEVKDTAASSRALGVNAMSSERSGMSSCCQTQAEEQEQAQATQQQASNERSESHA